MVGDEVITLGWIANHEPFIVIPTDEDRYWNYRHRFDSDGRGDKAWFDNGRDISFGGGWGDAPGIAEEFPSYHAVPRLLLRSNGGPVTFGVPLGAWFRNDLRAYLKDHLARGARIDEYLSRPVVDRLLDEHERGLADHGHRLWTLLTLEIWLRSLVGAR